ncbi:hypothetical protein FMM68_12040 [Lachnospiraceae bacterium MD329]|nr:hypothetical protein [Lachnospiraceae bacterium MD329]
MNRKILLIEPDYKNKYPPMGLMKIATYYRRCKDDVRFFKGNLKKFVAQLLCEEYYEHIQNESLGKYFSKLVEYIRTGKYAVLDTIPNFRNSEFEEKIKLYRKRYTNDDIPKFDVVCVTTLFTFYWKKTVDTINFAKKFCKKDGKLMVGGIASTILPEQIFKETEVHPHIGLLDHLGDLDEGNTDIIDELPLDYSILEEIDYKYPVNNAYLGYMTRGCPRNCSFCAVSRLEPNYKNYIGLKKQLKYIEEHFGSQKDLLLMDNNVFASNCFDKIIDEIKECGFERGAKYQPKSDYDIAMNNIRNDYNIRGYCKKMIKLYDDISNKLSEVQSGDFYLLREKYGLLYAETSKKEAIIEFDEIARHLYNKLFKKLSRARYIDFNQGVDARLVTKQKMKKLSEINIRPLRIAFDHYSLKDIYEKAVRIAVEYGIKDLSNYLLYNFEDKPEELYYRIKMNIDLCEELDAAIYSFPMKYHPIDDPKYFMNRDYIGKHWNRKFIRAIQAILNSTKGKIGRGKSFFEEAFGKDINEYNKLLWMPETFIIYRRQYDKELRERLAERYTRHSPNDSDLANEWWGKFSQLSPQKLEKAKNIIAQNKFKDGEYEKTNDKDIEDVLSYYKIYRPTAEKQI